MVERTKERKLAPNHAARTSLQHEETKLIAKQQYSSTSEKKQAAIAIPDPEAFNTPAERIIEMLKEIQSDFLDDSEASQKMKKRINQSINALYDKKNLFKIDEREAPKV